MTLPSITKNQKVILDYLYSFRFLHTNHFQKLFNHKDKSTVKEWLKDLRKKGYIAKVAYEEESFVNRTKPHIYCLTLKARHLLKNDSQYELSVLKKLYREKNRTEKFITKCLSLADMYLFLLSQKEQDQEIEFFTENELVSYTFFPPVLPSAYIAVTTKDDTQRYFLEVFDAYTPSFVLRNKLTMYLRYAKSGEWEAHTNNEPLPAILFVCPSKKIKSHVYFRAKAIFTKAGEELIDLYLTSWDSIKSNKTIIWEKVGITDG